MTTYIETKVISLNSESATTYNNGSYLSDLNFSLSNLLKDEPDILHKQITLANAQIPVSFYIVNYTNNVLKFNYNASSYNLTIPVGNYNSTALISTLTSLLLDIGIAMTINISKLTGRLTFTATQPFTFNSTNSITTANQILGLDGKADLTATLVGSNYVAVLPFPCNLLGIKQLMIKSGIISANNFSSSSNGQTTLIATIPVDSGAWGMINYIDTGGSKISFNNAIIDEIDIQILDAETNKAINFWNSNWTLTILLHITRKLDLGKAVPLLNDVVDKGEVPSSLRQLKLNGLKGYTNQSKDEEDLNFLTQ